MTLDERALKLANDFPPEDREKLEKAIRAAFDEVIKEALVPEQKKVELAVQVLESITAKDTIESRAKPNLSWFNDWRFKTKYSAMDALKKIKGER